MVSVQLLFKSRTRDIDALYCLLVVGDGEVIWTQQLTGAKYPTMHCSLCKLAGGEEEQIK